MTATAHYQPSGTEQPTFRVLSILVQFLTTPNEINSDLSIIRTIIPPGMALPIHKHADPEIFYLLEGSLEVLREANGDREWDTFKPGEIVSIAGSVVHAVRNSSREPVLCLIVTKKELYSFLRELAHPHREEELIGPPAPSEVRELFAAADKHRYWMASPEENAAVGLFVESQTEVQG